MAGPWEKYAQQSTGKPWEKYADPVQAKSSALDGGLPLRPFGVDTGVVMPEWLSNTVAGFGQGLTEIGRGVGQRVGLVSQEEIREAQRRDQELLDTTGGTVGSVLGNVAALAPTAFIPGANTLTGAALVGGASGFIQPVAEGNVLAESAKNAGLGALAGGAGQLAGQGIGVVAKRYAAAKAASAAAQKATNQVKDATAAMAKDAGYVIPPTQINPSKINQMLEGFAGKITTGQSASIKNQEVTNRMVKSALGLAPDEPITPQALTAIRNEAGRAYEALRGAGQIAADAQYSDDLGRIVAKYQGAGKDFPELAKNEIADTVANLQKDAFASDSALDAISILREKADKAFRGGDKSFGRAYKQMADSIESLIERNIAATGDDGAALLKDFRDARQLIAKTYSVESALNPATGNVNAKKLAQQLSKGKPLSGELKQVGQFAQAFPTAAQEVTSSMPGVSPLDFGTAAITSGATGNPGLLAMVTGRPLARGAILSGPYQRVMTTPSYAPGLGVLSANALASPITNPLLRLTVPASVYAAQE